MSSEFNTIAYDQLFTSRDSSCFLGWGSFSQVYRCYHNARGDLAVKILDTNMKNPFTSFSNEGKMHLKANSFPHILTLLGLSQGPPGFIGLVLEYMPYGSLADLIFKREEIDIPWTFRLRALSEVAAAINYLHNLTEQWRLIHCDLKAENILLNGDLHAKIGDFGGATLSSYTGVAFQSSTVSTDKSTRNNDLVQYTLSYAAPELLGQLDAKRTPYMDIYSFAIILYVTSTRSAPYVGLTERVIKVAVKDGQRPNRYLDEITEKLDGENDLFGIEVLRLFRHLMDKCWQQEPRQRLKMDQVRDSLISKLKNIRESEVAEDVLRLKQQLQPGNTGMPADAITVHEKYLDLRRNRLLGGGATHQSTQQCGAASFQYFSTNREKPIQPNIYQPSFASPQQSVQHQPPQPPQYVPRKESHRESPPRSLPQLFPPQQPSSQHHSSLSTMRMDLDTALPQPAVRRKVLPQPAPTHAAIAEFEASFTDPYLREGNSVQMICDIAAIKNAQIGHGGWDDFLMGLRDMEGKVRKIEDNGDVHVDFSGVRSHRFNPNSLAKIPSDKDLHVGDFVNVILDKELVKIYQEGHGGWVDEMEQFINQPALISSFLPDRDVCVVYKNGKYFRFNPDVLCKTNAADHLQELCLQGNPDIKIGDYVYHVLEDEVLKNLQVSHGGWNTAMSELKGRVGKFVYADYHGHAFVAYSSKFCFMYNPAALTRLTREEALHHFRAFKEETKRLVHVRAQDQIRDHRFSVNDTVRVCLPLDIVIELQKSQGGWCYQMLEVYGVTGVVKGFDEGNNAQVLFDTGNKWTFNPNSLEKLPPGNVTPAPAYVPPFHIGDKVRFKDLNNTSLNKMTHIFRLLDISEEKADILMKSGEVLGIDDDIDVIVSCGDGKKYGIKPEQLEKI